MADPSAFEVESGAPEPARPDLLFRPGDRLGRWQILGLLGRGAQGLVYEARDEATGQLAALKVLREAPEQSAEAELPPGQAGAETLRREAAILAELAHPNLIAARGLEAIEGRAVLVLEPIDGICLADRLSQAERPITEEIGSNRVVGTDPGRILGAYRDIRAGRGPRCGTPPLWDGRAAERIVEVLLR